MFHNLVYKAWSIPNMIREKATQLIDRIPTHVFVATQSDWVVWDHTILSKKNPDSFGNSTCNHAGEFDR
jgi:hypothetical protein